MAIRTPRRRISPRTKRRYRAIRNFLQKALCNSTKAKLKINSDIAVNVTEFKRKKTGTEWHTNDVNLQCEELHCLDFEKDLENLVKPILDTNGGSNDIIGNEEVARDPDKNYRNKEKAKLPKLYNKRHTKESKKILNKNTTTNGKNPDSASSQPSINMSTTDHRKNLVRKTRRNRKREKKIKENLDNQETNAYKFRESITRNRQRGKIINNVDYSFIADIIRKQYNSVNYYGQLHSDASQFSAPVCRDQENINNRQIYHTQFNNAYVPTQRHHRNVDEYDFIPVKDETSLENEIGNQSNREVLPSLKTMKPKLNLKANYKDFKDCADEKLHRNKQRLFKMANDNIESRKKISNDFDTLINPKASSNKNIGVECIDSDVNTRTEKTLNEIKDLLKEFLHEIKKEVAQNHVNQAGSVVQEQAPKDKVPSPQIPIAYCTHPYCYPLTPIYSMQSGYLMQSPCLTCHECKNKINVHREQQEANGTRNETQDLIREIYNCVSQTYMNSTRGKKESQKSDSSNKGEEIKCEGVDDADPSNDSDTVLDKISLKATHSVPDLQSSSIISKQNDKPKKRSSFLKFLTFGSMKRNTNEDYKRDKDSNKRDKDSKPSYYEQNFTTYRMQSSDCKHQFYRSRNNGENSQTNTYLNQGLSEHQLPIPSAPPYEYRYPSQIPLCMKDIEVRNVGTQCEKKLSFFKKIQIKMQAMEQNQFAEQKKSSKTFFRKNLDQIPSFSGFQHDDLNVRDALLKRFFYKQNPFSQKTWLLKALLNDKSGPEQMFMPKLFL